MMFTIHVPDKITQQQTCIESKSGDNYNVAFFSFALRVNVSKVLNINYEKRRMHCPSLIIEVVTCIINTSVSYCDLSTQLAGPTWVESQFSAINFN